jgi:ABC-2 type transport system ATP-binding protein
VIRLADITAHAAPFSLTKISLELGAGLHAVLGTPADGAPLLLAVAAGWVRPRSGQVVVLGTTPAAARRQVAYIPQSARLPPSLRVAEVLDAAADIRGERAAPARARLEALGIAPLADRWTQTLTAPEARAVLLAEAITSNVRVLLLDEPFVDVDPRAAGALGAKLRERAAAGATVVVATSSPRDALELSNEQWVLSFGRLVGAMRATDTPLLSAGTRPRLRVVARDARTLLGALASEPYFSGVELDDQALFLSGADPAAMAEAVARAALATGVELESMHVEAPRLEELRDAAARRRPTSLRPPGPPHAKADAPGPPPGVA